MYFANMKDLIWGILIVVSSCVAGQTLAPTTETISPGQTVTLSFETGTSSSNTASATNQGCGINGFAQVPFLCL